MNKLYLLLLMPFSMLFSCSNDDVLSVSKELNLSISQAISPIQVFIGDTVKINLVAAINDDNIKRIEIIEVPNNVKDLRDEIKFTLIDNTVPLSMDKDGYLSRKISSLMMKHSIIINKDASLMGKSMEVKYRVTSESGAQKTITAYIQITNYINNTVMTQFLLADAQKGMFFDPVENKSYDKDNYKQNKDKIEMVVYADAGKKYYCLNPAAPETETVMKTLGFDDYNASEMRTTKFEINNAMNYYLMTDVELAKIVLKKPVDKVQLLTDNMSYFVTQDKKNGCIRAKIVSSNFNLASKMQGVVRK